MTAPTRPAALPKGECQCPRCGRLHRKAFVLPTHLGGELSHEQYCRLSRVFNEAADLSINSPDYPINEWLKVKITSAVILPAAPPEGENFVEWIEPFAQFEGYTPTVTMRVKVRDVIRVQKMRPEYADRTDQEALDDFIVVHWAKLVPVPEGETDRTVAERIAVEYYGTDVLLSSPNGRKFVHLVATALAAARDESRARIADLELQLDMAKAADAWTEDDFKKLKSKLAESRAALELAQEVVGDFGDNTTPRWREGIRFDDAEKAIDEALSSLSEGAQSETASPSMRDAALEEAAQRADNEPLPQGDAPQELYLAEPRDIVIGACRATRKAIAEGIRSLKSPPPGETP